MAAPNITGARYSVDNPSWVTGVVTHAMSATDGSFNSSNEVVSATLDTTGWSSGRHTVFIEARSGGDDWGVPTAVFVHIQSAPLVLSASLQPGGVVLSWPSATNALYTLLATTDPATTFSVLASNIPAQPPNNLFTDAVSTLGARFYRLGIEP